MVDCFCSAKSPGVVVAFICIVAVAVWIQPFAKAESKADNKIVKIEADEYSVIKKIALDDIKGDVRISLNNSLGDFGLGVKVGRTRA